MSNFAPVLPHGEIEEVFSDIFFVTGTVKPTFEGMNFQFSRSMTIVREGDALTLVNTVRLDDAGLAKLDSLGKVKHVVKLGAFHGMDDAFYRDRHSAKQWALPGTTHEGGHETDEVLSNGNTPFSSASVFAYDVEQPEGLLLLEREGGILISCDSLQNWSKVDRFFDEPSAKMMTDFGFIKPANIGPGWLKAAGPQPGDFAKVKGLAFKHLLPAHGTPLKNEAHAKLSETFKALFDV